MEDCTVRFEEVIDNLTIQELKEFKEKLNSFYAERLAKELEATNERLKMLNYLQENNLNTN